MPFTYEYPHPAVTVDVAVFTAVDGVVNAAGPWAGSVSELAELAIPLTPLRRQWLTTTHLPKLPPDFPFVIDFINPETIVSTSGTRPAWSDTSAR